MIGIYKIENLINGKVYIGQSKDIKKRWSEHCKISQKLNEQYRRSYIHNAIQKYGLENFSFIVIEQCDLKDLDKKEIEWIAKYHSYVGDPLCNGYNLTIGGQGTRKITDEDIKDIVNLWEQGLTIGEIKTITGFCNESIVQHLKKYSKTYTSKESCNRCNYRPVGVRKIFNQYTLRGELIGQFFSLIQASKQLNIDKNNLSKHLQYKTKTCNGYIFILDEEDQLEGIKKHLNMIGTRQRPVVKLTLDNKLISYYNTMKEASLSCGKKDGMKIIRKCCRREQENAYGFKWRYVDENILTYPVIDDKINSGYAAERIENV